MRKTIEGKELYKHSEYYNDVNNRILLYVKIKQCIAIVKFYYVVNKMFNIKIQICFSVLEEQWESNHVYEVKRTNESEVKWVKTELWK